MRISLLCLFACGSNVVRIDAVSIGQAQVTPVSHQLWVLSAVDREANAIACDTLLSRQRLPVDEAMIALIPPVEGSLDESAVIPVEQVPAGVMSVVYVDFYSGDGATGERVAAGCADNVQFERGKRIDINIVMVRP